MGLSFFHIHKDRFMIISNVSNKHDMEDRIAELFYYIGNDIEYDIASFNDFIETDNDLYDTYCMIKRQFDWYPVPVNILRVPDTMLFIMALQNYISHDNKLDILLYQNN